MTEVRTTHEVPIPSPRPRPRVDGQEDGPERDEAIGYPGVRYALAHCTALQPRAGAGPAAAPIPPPRS